MEWTNSTPPKDQQRHVTPVIRCRPGRPLRVIHLSEAFFGVMTHWDGKRTVYCPGPNNCHLCSHQVALWKGYACVRQWDSQTVGILQVTPLVWETLNQALVGRESMTGLKGIYTRLGKELNSPLALQTCGFSDVDKSFSFDETSSLVKRIFRFDSECRAVSVVGRTIKFKRA